MVSVREILSYPEPPSKLFIGIVRSPGDTPLYGLLITSGDTFWMIASDESRVDFINIQWFIYFRSAWQPTICPAMNKKTKIWIYKIVVSFG